jgi:hypothetical protein
MKRSPMKRSAPMRKKGETAEDALWRDVRNATLERDQWACQGNDRGLEHRCAGGIEVHHILPRSRGGAHHPANCITLCLIGHGLVHANPEHSYGLGLLQRSGDAECANCHHVSRLHSITYGTCTFGAFGLECSCRAFQEAA